MRLQGKVGLITGGTSGIGSATAVRFAKEGAKVAITGRNAERGAKVVAQVEEVGGEGLFIACDVRLADDCKNAVDATLELHFTEWGAEQRGAVGPRAPYHAARRNVTRLGVPRNRGHVDFVRAAIEVDDVARDPRYQEGGAVLRCALVELVDVDVRIAKDRRGRGFDLALDVVRNEQARVRHFDEHRRRRLLGGGELDERHEGAQAVNDSR